MTLREVAPAEYRRVRPEFRRLVAKASSDVDRSGDTSKMLLLTIGLIGFTLTFIFLILPMKRPESAKKILRQRLQGAFSPFGSKEEMKKFLWTKEYMAVLKGYERQRNSSYIKLLTNYLNSRRIVSIIRKESSARVAKVKKCRQRVIRDCLHKLPNLKGKLHIKKWVSAINNQTIEGNKLHLEMHEGIWSSRHCSSRHSVAIIIPYRQREKQLRILLHHLPKILKRQRINYSIFVIEQTGNSTFNKGILMNAGFLTALTRPAHGVIFHCFIFHDVDLLAEDDRNMYSCPGLPRHMSVAVDELGYELPYSELLGGVFAIMTEHFLKLNGYSNSYWGWGGEDDDMGLRVKFAFGQTLRPDQSIGRYSSIEHQKLNPTLPLKIRRRLKRLTRVRYKVDGLNTVKYRLVKVEEKYQYTHVVVDVGLPPDDMIYNETSQLVTNRQTELLKFAIRALIKSGQLNLKGADRTHWRNSADRINWKLKK